MSKTKIKTVSRQEQNPRSKPFFNSIKRTTPMKKNIAVVTLVLLIASMAMAQATSQPPSQAPSASMVSQAPSASMAANAPPTGLRKEFLGQYDIFFKKVIDLATKMPEDKYDWRPAEGVRSIGEVYLHIGIANYGLARFFGGTIPTDINLRTLEKSKPGKAKTIEFLKRSNDYVRNLIATMPDADLEKPVTVFGNPMTYRGAIVFMGMHHSEHLGQSIAYARSVGVTPPWSEEAPAKPAAAPVKK
jgi:uncharacterized damage-inducible protein DinB